MCARLTNTMVRWRWLLEIRVAMLIKSVNEQRHWDNFVINEILTIHALPKKMCVKVTTYPAVGDVPDFMNKDSQPSYLWCVAVKTNLLVFVVHFSLCN